MDNRKRKKIRRCLLGLEVDRIKFEALVEEIRDILDEDEKIQREAKLHNKRSKKNGRFKRNV